MRNNKPSPMQNPPSKSSKKVAVRHEEIVYQGPIPPANQLKAYDDISSGLADRIVKMAEDQAAHRQTIEKIVVTANARNSTLGVLFGFLLGVIGICAGAYVCVNGAPGFGFATIITAVGSLIGVFIYGKSSNQKELREKQKIMKQQQEQQQ